MNFPNSVNPSVEIKSLKRLKEQVRRNITRFPEDFMFELSEKEKKSIGFLVKEPRSKYYQKINTYI